MHKPLTMHMPMHMPMPMPMPMHMPMHMPSLCLCLSGQNILYEKFSGKIFFK